MKPTLLTLSAAVLLGAAPARAQTPWIHVEVNETTEDASHVKVNLPLSVVAVALEVAPDKIVENGRIHLHSDDDLDVASLRKLWNELRDTPESEWVSVEQKDATVSIRREKDQILVQVEDLKDKDTVHVQVPVKVVDALLSGEGDELNLKDAITELKALRGDIVRVDDGDAKVRIWIDEKD